MTLFCIYRISDSAQKTTDSNGNNIIKTKPDYITKKGCLKNFINVFGVDNLYIIADNVSDNTYEFLKSFNINSNNIFRTNFGNGAASFRKALSLSLQNFDVNDSVYFVEDDYLHLNNANKVLLEGLEIFDYVTLYDHPDKYISAGTVKNKVVGNPLISDNSEETRVYLTENTHWKLTNSSTMTFACKVSVLKQDLKNILEFVKTDFPYDFNMFRSLIISNKRKLGVCIPGMSTHGESIYLSPLVDWEKIGSNI